jgi:filamentous hemagglutinin family protein
MTRPRSNVLPFVVLTTFVFFQSNISFALPEGESVVSGSATFDRSISNQLTVNTPSDKLIVNYDRFSIAGAETVNFSQPSANSIALNRVTSIQPSEIFGKLNANGKVWIINPNGIVFGAQTRVDTAGLLASTLNITNDDFLNGTYNFFQDGNPRGIQNWGQLTSANGGYVVLLSNLVANMDVITANLGNVVLASGEKMTVMNLDDAGDISVRIDQAIDDGVFGDTDAIRNNGRITADGGKVVLTAKVLNNIFNYAINNTGIVEAKAMFSQNGIVQLVGDGDNVRTGNITAGSSVDISSTNDITRYGWNRITTLTTAVTSTGGNIGTASEPLLTRSPNVKLSAEGNLYHDDAETSNVSASSKGGILDLHAGGSLDSYDLDSNGGLMKLGAYNIYTHKPIDTEGGSLEMSTIGQVWLSGTVNTQGGHLYITNDNKNTNEASGLQAPMGTKLLTNGGDVRIDSNQIFYADDINAGTGNVSMTARFGNIINGHPFNRIIANDLTMSAPNGSITGVDPFTGGNRWINTRVDTLSANAGGKLNIYEDDGITLNNVSSGNRNMLEVISSGTMKINGAVNSHGGEAKLWAYNVQGPSNLMTPIKTEGGKLSFSTSGYIVGTIDTQGGAVRAVGGSDTSTIQLDAVDNLYIDAVEARNGSVLLTAFNGSIYGPVDPFYVSYVHGDFVQMIAKDNIGSSVEPIYTDGNAFDLRADNGSIFLRPLINEPTHSTYFDSVKAPKGAVSIDSIEQVEINSILADQNIDVSTETGDIVFIQGLTSNRGAVHVTADDGDVIAKYAPIDPNIRGNDGSFIRASGTIGVVGGNALLINAIGDFRLRMGSEIDGTSGRLTGWVMPSSGPVNGQPIVESAPGEVYFNGNPLP